MEKAKTLLFSVTKKDLKIEFFSGTGAGGQHRNKHQNCARMSHPDSGASSTGQSSRSRQDNLKEAFKGLIASPKFRVWQSQKLMEIFNEKTIEQIVDEQMDPSNLVIEGQQDGKWEVLHGQ